MVRGAMQRFWNKSGRESGRIITQYPDDVLIAIASLPIKDGGTPLRESLFALLRIPALEYVLPDGVLHLEYGTAVNNSGVPYAAIYYEFHDGSGCVASFYTDNDITGGINRLNSTCLALKAGSIYAICKPEVTDE